jgi:hypothetical protein
MLAIFPEIPCWPEIWNGNSQSFPIDLSMGWR